MSNTLDQSTSTYVTISSESKWKIEWLNSTSWKRTINLRTFSQKHYQENGSNFFFTPRHEEFDPELSDAFHEGERKTVMGRVLLRDSGLFFSIQGHVISQLEDPKKKAVPLLIPYGRFTKMIIYYLGSTRDVHKRPESPCHLPGDDFLLGNLKFISKGETDEVFGMAIPKQLITQAIQQSSYYPKYLEIISKNTKKTPQDSASKCNIPYFQVIFDVIYFTSFRE
ncbi:hypothetical protein Tco_0269861 [Tanacetum coccineum]